MQAFRSMLVVFVALLFVFSTNRCVLAATLAHKVEQCCVGKSTGDASDRNLPATGMDCAPCRTLESGLNLAALAPLVIPAPVWSEDGEVAEFLRRLSAMVIDVAPAAAPDPAAMPAPLWNDVMKKALPVRGPSLAV